MLRGRRKGRMVCRGCFLCQRFCAGAVSALRVARAMARLLMVAYVVCGPGVPSGLRGQMGRAGLLMVARSARVQGCHVPSVSL